MIDYLILILLLVVIVILFWLGRSYATISTTEQWQEERQNGGGIMMFYHGTTKDKWVQVLKEGMLFGKREGADRCTYLATDIEEAKCYGDVVLTVAYDPTKHPDKNNYVDGCWQFRVYEPIYLGQIEDVLYL